MAGKGIGKVWDKARGAFRDAPDPVPAHTIPAAGVDIPVNESVVTRSPATSARVQAMKQGDEGVGAQRVAQDLEGRTDAGFQQAHGNIETSLGASGTTPMAAGEAVSSELASREAARAAAEARRLQGVGNETGAIREALNTSPTPGVLADTPRSAQRERT